MSIECLAALNSAERIHRHEEVWKTLSPSQFSEGRDRLAGLALRLVAVVGDVLLEQLRQWLVVDDDVPVSISVREHALSLSRDR